MNDYQLRNLSQHKVDKRVDKLCRKHGVRCNRFGFKYLGAGRHREVYLSPSQKFVVKFPRTYYEYQYDEGARANESEYRIYRSGENNGPGRGDTKFARCRLIKQILIMEYVDRKVDFRSLPGWAHYIDCSQVGIARSGELVAFDYSSN